jgi:hypothetical protein
MSLKTHNQRRIISKAVFSIEPIKPRLKIHLYFESSHLYIVTFKNLAAKCKKKWVWKHFDIQNSYFWAEFHKVLLLKIHMERMGTNKWESIMHTQIKKNSFRHPFNDGKKNKLPFTPPEIEPPTYHRLCAGKQIPNIVCIISSFLLFSHNRALFLLESRKWQMTDGVHSKCNFQFHEKAVWVNWGTSLYFIHLAVKKSGFNIKARFFSSEKRNMRWLLTSLRSSLYIQSAILHFSQTEEVNGATELQCALTWSAARGPFRDCVICGRIWSVSVAKIYALERMCAANVIIPLWVQTSLQEHY